MGSEPFVRGKREFVMGKVENNARTSVMQFFMDVEIRGIDAIPYDGSWIFCNCFDVVFGKAVAFEELGLGLEKGNEKVHSFVFDSSQISFKRAIPAANTKPNLHVEGDKGK